MVSEIEQVMSVLRRTMKDRWRETSAGAEQVVTVSFGEAFESSLKFEQVFKEGMALVERTAAYLDGEGRREARSLSGAATVLYATESMRLTTRLLDLASWLLIRRELRDGAISEEEALRKRERIKLKSFGRPSHTKGFADLPAGLKGLVLESFGLYDRIMKLDRSVCETSEDAAYLKNPVGEQMQRLREAFEAR